MDRVKRTRENLKTRRLISKEEEILKKRSKPFRADLIDLTLDIPKSKHSGADAIVDARYKEIEKMFLDDMYKTAAGSDTTKNTTIEKQAERAKADETRRMKECYLNPDYMAASQRARDSRRKMIELLEAQGIDIDEAVEF